MKTAREIAEVLVFGRPASQCSETLQAMSRYHVDIVESALTEYGNAQRKLGRNEGLEEAACFLYTSRKEGSWDFMEQIRSLKTGVTDEIAK